MPPGAFLLHLHAGLVPSTLPSGWYDDHQDDSKDQDQNLFHSFTPFSK